MFWFMEFFFFFKEVIGVGLLYLVSHIEKKWRDFFIVNITLELENTLAPK